MSSRVRYDDVPDAEGVLFQSRQVYGTRSGDTVRVYIDKPNCSFEIQNVQTGVAIVNGGSANYIVLLRKIKRALVNLGCDFAIEERDRDYGVVKK